VFSPWRNGRPPPGRSRYRPRGHSTRVRWGHRRQAGVRDRAVIVEYKGFRFGHGVLRELVFLVGTRLLCRGARFLRYDRAFAGLLVPHANPPSRRTLACRLAPRQTRERGTQARQTAGRSFLRGGISWWRTVRVRLRFPSSVAAYRARARLPRVHCFTPAAKRQSRPISRGCVPPRPDRDRNLSQTGKIL
jgi:hypothetical protein